MMSQAVPRRTRWRWGLLLLVVLVSAGIAPSQVAAQATPVLRIETEDGQPATAFAVQVEPGEEADLQVRFAVSADDTVTAIVSVRDVTSPANGGLALAPADAAPHAPATWIGFEAETLTLEPGTPETRTVPVSVPDDARPGQYVAALVLQATTPAPIAGSPGIGQVARSVATITITVPGELDASFELGEPVLVQQGTGGIIQVPVTNTGTVPVYPAGTLTLETRDGEQVASTPVAMGAVYAGVGTVLEVPLDAPPGTGDYLLSLALTDADTRTVVTMRDQPIAIPEVTAPATPAVASPTPVSETLVTFQNIDIAPAGTPLETIGVQLEVSNMGAPLSQATLTLLVSRNGQLVEESVVAEGVSLADGVTSFSTRYAPPDGFSTGLWTFRLRLDTVSDTGAVTLLVQSGTVAKIDVP